MDWTRLVPTPDTIPAPWWVFELLDVVTLTVHLLLINVVVGGSILLLVSRLFGRGKDPDEALPGPLGAKIPTVIALAINFGVAPLLFVQVLYGHLIYSSSVLMAAYWLLIVPLLILASYGAYVHAHKRGSSHGLALGSLAVTTGIVLYIGFMLVNNMSLAWQPDRWTGYFDNRGGTMLNLSDPTVIPRYLHFLTASVAVGGLASALLWRRRQKAGHAGAGLQIVWGLRVFGVATLVQLLVGFWLLAALPDDVMVAFLGGVELYTWVLMFGISFGIAAAIAALLGTLTPTLILALCTIVTMIVHRSFVRAAYLGRFFTAGDLEVSPQYGVMALFFLVFAVGLAVAGYVLKVALAASRREVAR